MIDREEKNQKQRIQIHQNIKIENVRYKMILFY